MNIKVKRQFEFGKPTFMDVSLLGIVLGNIVTAGLAYTQRWDIGEIMWVYWAQSVLIGVTNVIRMMSLTEFTTKGMTSNGSPVPETPAAKRQVATFFALHYGFFHAGYAVFLWHQLALSTLASEDRVFLVFCAAAFVMSHGFSLKYNQQSDFRDKKPNLGTLMFYPYLRVIPMHIAILIGSQLYAQQLAVFMGLKLLADVGMHIVEHSLFRGAGRADTVPARE